MNIYKKILESSLPRLINLFDLDSLSATYGYADREYWGWKTKDFANGTMQGGIHSLAIAYKLGLIEKQFILKLVHESIQAVNKILNKNGALEEAYPKENSFCVTALVAFDCLSALSLLQDILSKNKKDQYLSLIKPLITFISKNIESHAIISNHLATGAAATVLWNTLTKNNNAKSEQLLNTIYEHQSDEGWYKEYEGADPGYQTLCTYYLASVYKYTKDEKLKKSLIQSIRFLKYFVHPDGSIGGLYGSRNTEVYYPGGIISLAGLDNDFALTAKNLETGYENKVHILPETIDIGNFIPLLNSYAHAALYYEEYKSKIPHENLLLTWQKNTNIDFKRAGIYVHSTPKYYAIINYKKGGTIKVFNKITNNIDLEDGGVGGILKNGKKFSTQQFDNSISFDNYVIDSGFYSINEAYPTPFKFMILRMLSLTFFRCNALNNRFKKIIVYLLMTGKKKLNGKAIRTFVFADERITIKEELYAPKKKYRSIGHYGKFKAIHMASSGYFNNQMVNKPDLVTIETTIK